MLNSNNQIFKTLPEDYHLLKTINLKEDKLTLIGIAATAILIGWVMIEIMDSFVPLKTYFEPCQNTTEHILAYVFLLMGAFICIVLHKLTKGLSMKRHGASKVFFHFNGIGCREYIGKKPYTFIALAPLVIWGIIFLLLILIIKGQYFWLVYFIQVVNVAGSMGDIYAALVLRKCSDDTLVEDKGTIIHFYSKTEDVLLAQATKGGLG